MQTSLTDDLPESLKSVRTRPLFVLREQVPPLFVVGQTPNGFRRIGIVPGGHSRVTAFPAKLSAVMIGSPCGRIRVSNSMSVFCSKRRTAH